MARRLTLLRGRSTDQGTPGVLLREDGSRVFHSLELPWRENQRRVSCIPAGVYPVGYIVTEKRPSGVYLVRAVVGRDSILIHSGNVAGDVTKGFESDVLGCVLGGQIRGYRRGQLAVLCSKPAIRMFVDEMAQVPFVLEVVWTSSPS